MCDRPPLAAAAAKAAAQMTAAPPEVAKVAAKLGGATVELEGATVEGAPVEGAVQGATVDRHLSRDAP